MSEEQIVNNQANEENHDGSSNVKQEAGVTRRDFLQQTVAVASGLALSSALPAFDAESQAAGQQAANPCTTNPPPLARQSLIPITELTRSSDTKTLQVVLKILNEEKRYWTPGQSGDTVCNYGQMRFYSGYNLDPTKPNQKWPTAAQKGLPAPGPTLRARVGDTVQITLLNQVDIRPFGKSLDVAEKGQGCDRSVTPQGTNIYPGDPSFETEPDCFHGSSTTNLHFHGTHVSPSTIADNVLVAVRPSPLRANGTPVVDEQYVKADFAKIFAACSHGHSPQKWEDLPLTWRQKQQKLLQDYDSNAIWKEKLWEQDLKDIKAGRWPQYYIGAYPSCFQLPIWNNKPDSMGQSPGTHWYHAHKHGSTALNLANGLAGALIIEGDYDDKLAPFITKQQVLVLQQIGTQLNLQRNPGSNLKPDMVFVNGQLQPVLNMKPNEMQLWRFVNACHRTEVPLDPPTGIKWVQTAQDGVQFDRKNYHPTITNAGISVPASANPLGGSLASGNRVDLLVQAPNTPGRTYEVKFGGKILLLVNVTNDTSIPNPMPFPRREEFPKLPDFLVDINPANVTVKRELHFASRRSDGQATGREPNAPFAPPKHTINGKQFDNVIDQSMVLGATEEWTLYNDSPGAAHPFHIHINPFQVVEILNPSISKNPVKLPAPWLWWDVFAIPPAAVPPDGDGRTLVSGHVKFLTRFVDFTGMYVLHCHILGHEDRGMMQLVQVVTNLPPTQHH